MKRIVFYHLLFGVALLLGSCGEFLDIDYSDLPGESDIKMERREVTVMAGDTCVLSFTLKQDDGVSDALYWESRNQEVATVSTTGVVRGVAEGDTRVMVMVLADLNADSLDVHVLPRWELSPYDFSHETMVCAQLAGFDAERMVLGAFVDGELRGVGVGRTTPGGAAYVELRVYGTHTSAANAETITFRLYHRGQGRLEELRQTVTFDGDTHGSPSAPLNLTN